MSKTLPERIFICGFMGTGKSTVGKQLAARLDKSFYDLDKGIEKAAGQDIPAIFKAEGEEGFRRREKTVLLDFIRTQTGVIALGGGSLHNQHLVDRLKVNGLLVFIETPMEKIIDRVIGTNNRPMLLNEEGEVKPKPVLEKEMQQLYRQRLPFYEQAQVTIQSEDFKSVDDLVAQLAKKIRYHVALH